MGLDRASSILNKIQTALNEICSRRFFIGFIEIGFSASKLMYSKVVNGILYTQLIWCRVSSGWKSAREKWMVGRLKESLPDLRKVSAEN